LSDEHHRKLERMYLGARTNEYYRPSIRISEGEATVRVPVRPDFHHPLGAVHGSVYFKLLDDAAFFAVSSLVEDVFVLTTSFNVYFTRPVRDGELTARGAVAHRSRRLWVAEAELVDEKGRALARGSGTFMKSRHPLGPELGYAAG
jgi:uncharacterized protein (TIGR00369 family)